MRARITVMIREEHVDVPPARRSLSLVIPMFNEEETIEHALETSVLALSRQLEEWEIIVVDDASTDDSAAIVEHLAEADPRVVLLRHETNRKLGETVRTGLRAATMDLVLYMDADLPFDPHEVGRAVRALEVTRADMIAGYRFDRTTEGFRRTTYSYAYNLLIGILFGWPHRDINFSFKLMRREILPSLQLKSEGSLIDAEIVVKAKNLGYVIQQMGFDYFPRTRGTSTLSSPRVILKIFRELIRLYPEMKRPRTMSDAHGSEHSSASTRPAS